MHLLPNVGNPHTDPRFSKEELAARVRRFDGCRRQYGWTGLALLFSTILWSGMLATTAKASAAAEGSECCEAAAIFKRVNGGEAALSEAVKAAD